MFRCEAFRCQDLRFERAEEFAKLSLRSPILLMRKREGISFHLHADYVPHGRRTTPKLPQGQAKAYCYKSGQA